MSFVVYVCKNDPKRFTSKELRKHNWFLLLSYPPSIYVSHPLFDTFVVFVHLHVCEAMCVLVLIYQINSKFSFPIPIFFLYCHLKLFCFFLIFHHCEKLLGGLTNLFLEFRRLNSNCRLSMSYRAILKKIQKKSWLLPIRMSSRVDSNSYWIRNWICLFIS